MIGKSARAICAAPKLHGSSKTARKTRKEVAGNIVKSNRKRKNLLMQLLREWNLLEDIEIQISAGKYFLMKLKSNLMRLLQKASLR